MVSADVRRRERLRDENKECLRRKLPAARSCDFLITRVITDRIGLHSVLLPLLINLLFEVLNLSHCSLSKALTFLLVREKRRDQTHLEIVTHFKTKTTYLAFVSSQREKEWLFIHD